MDNRPKNRLIAEQPHPMQLKRVKQVIKDRDECSQGYIEGLGAPLNAFCGFLVHF